MKSKSAQRDIWILLGFLMFFSGCVRIVFGQDERIENPFDVFTPGEIVERVSPLLITKSIQRVGQSLFNLPSAKLIETLKLLLSPEEDRLLRAEKVELVLDLAQRYRNQIGIVSDLFSLLLNDHLSKGRSVFFIAAQKNYPAVIPLLLKWNESKSWAANMSTEQQKINQEKINSWIKSGWSDAVQANRPKLLQIISQAQVPISKEYATDLLWRVVSENKNPLFVPPLIKHGADIASVRNGRTLLIAAVEKNNEDLASMLLSHGADINALPDPKVGNALQRAINLGHLNVELFLREKGARE